MEIPTRMREISLFSGAGGGLLASQHLLGFKTVCYVEIDAEGDIYMDRKTKREILKEDILRMRAQGYSYQRIADHLDKDKSSVWRIANDIGKPHPRPKFADAPVLDPELSKHKQMPIVRGEIAERYTIAKLMEIGFDVWIPAYSRHSSDIGLYINHALIRIQIKLAGYDEASNRFRCALATKRRNKFVGYGDEIDFFIIKCDGLDDYYIIPAHIGNHVGFVNLYPHREKLAFKGINYEMYRNNFEALTDEQKG